MKTIGLLGGMSWESTIGYYRLLNEGVRDRLGGLHSCKLIMNSVDFFEYEALMRKGDWDSIGSELSKAAQSVEAGGADVLLIGTNTMHIVADKIQAAVDIPLLHMADAIAASAAKLDVNKLGLLGTAFTMEKDFLTRPLLEKHGLDVVVPKREARDFIHQTIFSELCCGKLEDCTRDGYLNVIAELVDEGAEAIVLGCTEIGLLVRPQDVDVPLIDTVQAHVDAALEVALA